MHYRPFCRLSSVLLGVTTLLRPTVSLISPRIPNQTLRHVRPYRISSMANGRRTMATRLAASTTDETSAPVAATEPLPPTKGSVVHISCRLQPEGDFIPEPLIDGIVLHEEEPEVDLRFVLGWGNYLPGLHDMIASMRVGETRTNVSMDAGWGDVNPDLIATISFENSGLDPSKIKVGTQLKLAQQNLPCVVTEVTDTTFTIDANPPLAGASYLANVTLKAVEEGPVVGPYTKKPSSTSRFEVGE